MYLEDLGMIIYVAEGIKFAIVKAFSVIYFEYNGISVRM